MDPTRKPPFIQYARVFLLVLAVCMGLIAWVQTARADASPWPTPTPRPSPNLPLATATTAPTPFAPVPTLAPTLPLATVPAVIVTPQVITPEPTPAALSIPSLASLVCWPIGAALLLIIILVSLTVLRRA